MSRKIIKFSASWCSPCTALKEVMNSMDIDIPIEDVDIDEQPHIMVKYAIRGVPTVIMMEDGKEIRRFSGLKSVAEINKFIEQE